MLSRELVFPSPCALTLLAALLLCMCTGLGAQVSRPRGAVLSLFCGASGLLGERALAGAHRLPTVSTADSQNGKPEIESLVLTAKDTEAPKAHSASPGFSPTSGTSLGSAVSWLPCDFSCMSFYFARAPP